MSDPYKAGQFNAFEVAMTVLCRHCHKGYYGRTAKNDIERDGGWWRGDMRSAFHDVEGRKRTCRAAGLIPFIIMFKVPR